MSFPDFCEHAFQDIGSNPFSSSGDTKSNLNNGDISGKRPSSEGVGVKRGGAGEGTSPEVKDDNGADDACDDDGVGYGEDDHSDDNDDENDSDEGDNDDKDADGIDDDNDTDHGDADDWRRPKPEEYIFDL